ncbi:MAG: ornithine carbamoyltransferase [Vicinamibacterales bacterium]|jgi:ornithine carbamoyltransferase|nr:ornithine carbamoyltransferase [Vicinamibacterales bacterium]
MESTHLPHTIEDHERLHTALAGRDFLSLRDLATHEAEELFDRAMRMKANPLKYSSALRGKTLAMIFEKPSLRTRVSFEVGMVQLGGHALDLSASVSLGAREAIYDVAKNLERMVQGIMIRTFGHDRVERMAEFASVPVINGLTDFSHPCQGMADYLTMLEVKGRLKGLKVTYVGDSNNVTHSLMFGAALLGVHLRVGSPAGYQPDASALAWATAEAPRTGAVIEVLEDPVAAVRDADVVYTDTWTSMGQEQEAAMRRQVFLPYQVNDALMAQARRDAIFMHCLPAHRGEEVTDAVIDSAQSVVFPQAENRLHVQKALLFALMR